MMPNPNRLPFGEEGQNLLCQTSKYDAFFLKESHTNRNEYTSHLRIEPVQGDIQLTLQPASMAQLDAGPTGDQEVAGSTLAGSATFFRESWSYDIFYGHSLPSADSRRSVVSFWRKECAQYWLTA